MSWIKAFADLEIAIMMTFLTSLMFIDIRVITYSQLNARKFTGTILGTLCAIIIKAIGNLIYGGGF